MSLFLGPIHHWLFNKIKLFQEVEFDIISNIENELHIDLSDVSNKIREEHGNPIEDKPLEEQINEQNIHGWLQDRISECELRQAALITYLFNTYGDNALIIIKRIYKNQGVKCGINAKENKDVSTAKALYNAINDYILDGMPCDRFKVITISNDNHIKWEIQNCIHKKYWVKVIGNIDIFYDLRNEWIKSFIQYANNEFSYNFSKETTTEGVLLIREIKKGA